MQRFPKQRESRSHWMAALVSDVLPRKGLEQDIGDAAINKVPRAMIREAVEKRKSAAGIQAVFLWSFQP